MALNGLNGHTHQRRMLTLRPFDAPSDSPFNSFSFLDFLSDIFVNNVSIPLKRNQNKSQALSQIMAR